MKTFIALAVLALSSTAIHADWEDRLRNPDLSTNIHGYVEDVRLPADDPVAEAFPGNGDLYSGDTVEGGGGSSYGSLTSLEQLIRGNPDFEA